MAGAQVGVEVGDPLRVVDLAVVVDHVLEGRPVLGDEQRDEGYSRATRSSVSVSPGASISQPIAVTGTPARLTNRISRCPATVRPPPGRTALPATGAATT